MDSKRDRVIAMLTNAFVPCNGRFPTLTVIGGLFFAVGTGILAKITSAGILFAEIILSIFATMLVSWILSRTLLRGSPASFALELPPYRMPKVGQVVIRSVWERTLRVLGRAVAVSAPVGLLLWILANVTVGEVSLLLRMAEALDPVGKWIGLDGAILLGFLLALPANEIVLPTILMIYTASGGLTDYAGAEALGVILRANGWTVTTAICVTLLMLFHYPCATALWTLRKESGSTRLTLLAAALPTAFGILLCFLVSSLAKLLG